MLENDSVNNRVRIMDGNIEIGEVRGFQIFELTGPTRIVDKSGDDDGNHGINILANKED
jgi:hypothetical protein